MSASLVLTPILRRLCQRAGLVDSPQDDRRVHTSAIPRLGGVAIFLSMSAALTFLALMDNLITQAIRAEASQVLVVVLPATLVFLFGVYDDIRGADARLKFTVLGLAGTLFYFLGGSINAISIPFVGSVSLPPVLSFMATILWVVGISNAFNLIDGIDGLASGAALFASLVMFAVSLLLGNTLVTVCTIALSGALIGFLRYNFNPASIFLGDSGALFIGFILAALSAERGQKASTAVAVVIPLMAFGLPVIDTGIAILRRFISGKPLFQGDREHVHHMLLARGWSQRRTVFVLYAVCALFALLALLFVNDAEGKLTGLVLFIVGAAIIIAAGRLRYHEMDELKASMKRNLGERRIRAANHVRIRRASRALSEAKTLDKLFEAIQEMLESSEFIYATVQAGHPGEADINRRALTEGKGAGSLRAAKIKDGMISWSWERGDIEAGEIIGSSHFWVLRLPLATENMELGYINFYRSIDSDHLLLDINYICHLFQKEMSQAFERVLVAARVSELKTNALRKAVSSAGD
ncbi:MAG TPA: MraY family glycosyltransferase [Pyrinomonadaceae bacterium]